jgi:hypothetical protein
MSVSEMFKDLAASSGEATKDKRRPKHSLRLGSISGALWENEYENEAGTTGTSLSATIQRRFFNRQSNQWESSTLTILNLAELASVAEVARKLQQIVVDSQVGE